MNNTDLPVRDGNENTKKPDCIKCRYFAVSWDPNFPRSCRLYGFKTTSFPSVQVYNSSGTECLGFTEKKRFTRDSDTE